MLRSNAGPVWLLCVDTAACLQSISVYVKECCIALLVLESLKICFFFQFFYCFIFFSEVLIPTLIWLSMAFSSLLSFCDCTGDTCKVAGIFDHMWIWVG